MGKKAYLVSGDDTGADLLDQGRHGCWSALGGDRGKPAVEIQGRGTGTRSRSKLDYWMSKEVVSSSDSVWSQQSERGGPKTCRGGQKTCMHVTRLFQQFFESNSSYCSSPIFSAVLPSSCGTYLMFCWNFEKLLVISSEVVDVGGGGWVYVSWFLCGFAFSQAVQFHPFYCSCTALFVQCHDEKEIKAWSPWTNQNTFILFLFGTFSQEYLKLGRSIFHRSLRSSPNLISVGRVVFYSTPTTVA